MKKSGHIIMLALVGMLLASCHRKQHTTRYIPENALGIFSLNLHNLHQKATWAALSDSRIWKALSPDSLFSPEQAGIDDDGTLFAFGLPEHRLESGFTFLLVVPLKNEKQFYSYLRKRFSKAQFLETGDLHLVVFDEHTCLGWKKGIAIGAFTNPPSSFSAENTESTGASAVLTEDIQSAFALKQEQSIVKNQWFNALQKEEHDVSYWFNYEAFANALPQEDADIAGTVLSSQKKLLKNTYLAGGVDFEKGKIVSDGKYYYNPSGSAVANAFMTNRFNNDLLKKIPGRQLNLMASLHINPGGIKVLVDSMGLLPLTRLGLEENGLSADSVFNLFEGDFLFTVADLNFDSMRINLDENGLETAPFFQGALTFRIRDSITFRKLLDLGCKRQLLAFRDGMYIFRNYYLAYQNNYVVIAPFRKTVGLLLSNNTEKDWPLPQEIIHKPFSFYFDTRTTLNSFLQFFGNSEKATAAGGLLTDITAYTEPVKEDFMPFHITVSFQNSQENSLLQLVRFSRIMAAPTPPLNQTP